MAVAGKPGMGREVVVATVCQGVVDGGIGLVLKLKCNLFSASLGMIFCLSMRSFSLD